MVDLSNFNYNSDYPLDNVVDIIELGPYELPASMVSSILLETIVLDYPFDPLVDFFFAIDGITYPNAVQVPFDDGGVEVTAGVSFETQQDNALDIRAYNSRNIPLTATAKIYVSIPASFEGEYTPTKTNPDLMRFDSDVKYRNIVYENQIEVTQSAPFELDTSFIKPDLKAFKVWEKINSKIWMARQSYGIFDLDMHINESGVLKIGGQFAAHLIVRVYGDGI